MTEGVMLWRGLFLARALANLDQFGIHSLDKVANVTKGEAAYRVPIAEGWFALSPAARDNTYISQSQCLVPLAHIFFEYF